MSWKPIKEPEISRTYWEEAKELAFMMAPKIFPCDKCGHAVADGYVCHTCGNENTTNNRWDFSQ